jgi:hypothetical protein
MAWVHAIKENMGITIPFPVIADLFHGFIHPRLRSYIIHNTNGDFGFASQNITRDARGLYNAPDKYVRSTRREKHVDG